MEIKELTLKLAENPQDVENNFNLAAAYEHQLQYASAAGFYLRAAEYGYKTHPLITYASLLKMALCFSAQGERNRTVYNNIMQAVAYLPNRPEAYFLLARIKERNKEYQECYTFAELGLLFATHAYNQPLPGYVEYNGTYSLLFEKAVAGWWIGRKTESYDLFNHLLDGHEMSQEYVNSCLNNLKLFL
jgi:tetratricopeptide (TPR) repeat protein